MRSGEEPQRHPRVPLHTRSPPQPDRHRRMLSVTTLPLPRSKLVPAATHLLRPLLSQLGANGILIEYEDMFPFKGELEILKSPYAYR